MLVWVLLEMGSNFFKQTPPQFWIKILFVGPPGTAITLLVTHNFLLEICATPTRSQAAPSCANLPVVDLCTQLDSNQRPFA